MAGGGGRRKSQGHGPACCIAETGRQKVSSGKPRIYYRSDYIGLALIKNFFLVTIGYGLILAVIAAYNLEYLLDNVHKMDLISLGVVVLGGYIGILVLYSVLTYIQYTVKYHKAKKSVKQYYTQLTKLEKIYTREEKKFAGREMSGGYRK